MPENFSFVIPGKLAGLAKPGARGLDLRQDLERLRRAGVTALVSLTESGLPERAVEEAGLRHLHLPVVDYTPPTLDQIEEFVAFARGHLEGGSGAVGVHCHAGVGRTGTMLAAYLVSTGMSARAAIERIRRERPGSIETAEQEQAVHDWARHLKRKTKKQ